MPIRNVGSEMPISETAWKTLASSGIAPQRRIDPHQDAEHQRQDRGAGGELKRRRHALLQQVSDRLAELIGDAELELRRVDEVARELHRNRVVQPERLPDRGALGVGGVDRHHLVHGIAGETEHRERDDPDGEHDADGLDCTAKSESEHASRLSGTRCAHHCRPKTKGPGKRCASGTVPSIRHSCLVAQ